MKTIIHTLFLLLVLPWSLASCIKDGPPKPQPQEIENTMECTVNGRPWEDCQKGILGPMEGVRGEWFHRSSGRPLEISGLSFCDTPRTDIYIYIRPFNGVGEYVLSEGPFAIFTNHNFLFPFTHRTNLEHRGYINITKFDSMTARVSGTFSFEAYNPDSNTTCKIENGTFTNIRFYR